MMREWIEPPDVLPVCPKHGCALYPARPIPCPVEIEAVAKRLCWNSCKWDGVDSYAAKDEDDAWDYAGEIPGFHAEYVRQAKELLEAERRAVSE